MKDEEKDIKSKLEAINQWVKNSEKHGFTGYMVVSVDDEDNVTSTVECSVHQLIVILASCCEYDTNFIDVIISMGEVLKKRRNGD